MELRSDVMLYSNLGNENSDAGHVKCSRGPHLSCGPKVSHPWCTLCKIPGYITEGIFVTVSVRECIFLGMQKNFAQIWSCFP